MLSPGQPSWQWCGASQPRVTLSAARCAFQLLVLILGKLAAGCRPTDSWLGLVVWPRSFLRQFLLARDWVGWVSDPFRVPAGQSKEMAGFDRHPEATDSPAAQT